MKGSINILKFMLIRLNQIQAHKHAMLKAEEAQLSHCSTQMYASVF